MSRLPIAADSRAVLVGCSRYRHLSDLPAITNNLAAMRDVLTDPAIGGFSPEHCTVLDESLTPLQVFEALRHAATEAKDTFLVYFAGHGLLDGRNELQLALTDTRSDVLKLTGLAYDQVRDVMLESTAPNRVVILDCCFAGSAIRVMSGDDDGFMGQTQIEGSYILAAVPARKLALAPDGAFHTSFTAVLLEVLRAGIPDGPELITLSVLFSRLRSTLLSRGLPEADQSGTNTVTGLALTRNPLRAVHRRIDLAAVEADAMQERLGDTRLSAGPARDGTGPILVAPTTAPSLAVTLDPDVESRPARIPAPEPRSEPERGPARRYRRIRHLAFSSLVVAVISVTPSINSAQDRTPMSQGLPTSPSASDTVPPSPSWSSPAAPLLAWTQSSSTQNVRGVAFSPDSKTLVTGNSYPDSTARLWNPATGKVVRRLKGFTDSIDAVAFSPNGKILAGASGQIVRLSNPASGKTIRTLRPASTGTHSVAFSPDSKTIAIGGTDGKIELRNVATGARKRTFGTRTGIVSVLTFSPDGKTLAAGDAKDYVRSDNQGIVRLWDPATGRKQHVLKIHKTSVVSGSVQSLAFSPDGKSLAGTDGNGQIRIWDPATRKVRRDIISAASAFTADYGIAFSPDSRALAVCGSTGSAGIWDPVKGKKIYDLSSETAVPAGFRTSFIQIAYRPPITNIAFSSDRNSLAIATGGFLRLWSIDPKTGWRSS